MAVYMRWHAERGISLEAMQAHRSQDWDSYEFGAGRHFLPGICATQSADYLTRTLAEARERLELGGEVIVFEAQDTQEVCMDGEPVVIALEVFARIPVARNRSIESVVRRAVAAMQAEA